MLLLAVMGSRREAIVRPLVKALSSRGYRVATVTQAKKLRVPEDLREFAEAGAGIRMACSTDKVLISSNFPLRELNDFLRVLSSLAPMEPDAVIFLGFEDELADESRIFKAIVTFSSSEAKQLIRRVSPPVLGVYSERDSFEGGFSNLESLINAIIEEGIRRRLLQPSPGRLSSRG